MVFYDQSGREQQVFDYSTDDSVREFTSCAFNPSGETVVFGAYNRFFVYSHNLSRGNWEQVRSATGPGFSTMLVTKLASHDLGRGLHSEE